MLTAIPPAKHNVIVKPASVITVRQPLTRTQRQHDELRLVAELGDEHHAETERQP